MGEGLEGCSGMGQVFWTGREVSGSGHSWSSGLELGLLLGELALSARTLGGWRYSVSPVPGRGSLPLPLGFSHML